MARADNSKGAVSSSDEADKLPPLSSTPSKRAEEDSGTAASSSKSPPLPPLASGKGASAAPSGRKQPGSKAQYADIKYKMSYNTSQPPNVGSNDWKGDENLNEWYKDICARKKEAKEKAMKQAFKNESRIPKIIERIHQAEVVRAEKEREAAIKRAILEEETKAKEAEFLKRLEAQELLLQRREEPDILLKAARKLPKRKDDGKGRASNLSGLAANVGLVKSAVSSSEPSSEKFTGIPEDATHNTQIPSDITRDISSAINPLGGRGQDPSDDDEDEEAYAVAWKKVPERTTKKRLEEKEDAVWIKPGEFRNITVQFWS